MLKSKNSLENRIAEICLRKFDELPKTGKPNCKNEWTILSGIILEQNEDNLRIVSLGTGTKCISQNQMSDKGDIINDSHAEVLARRGLLRFLYEQIYKCAENKSSIFQFCPLKLKFVVEKNMDFHFFTTFSPCGDASIFENTSNDEPVCKRIKLDDNMTGAKLLVPIGDDLMTQDKGCLRTKPGRGVRTLSLSCSDKLSRWNFMGLQGALLMSLIEKPIYLKSVIFCSGSEFNKESLERAIWKRWKSQKLENFLIDPFKINKPEILLANNGWKFNFAKNNFVGDNLQPSACGTVWCDVENRQLEVVLSSGRRLGSTKKNMNSPENFLKVSKIELFKQFIGILKLYPQLADKLFRNSNEETSDKNENVNKGENFDDGKTINLNNLSYQNAKIMSKEYNEQWKALKANCFQTWTQKPENLQNFFSVS